MCPYTRAYAYHSSAAVRCLQAVDVTKLIKGKPLDNIEFMQWLKSYFDRITASQGVTNYDPTGRRAATKDGGGAAGRGGIAGPRAASARSPKCAPAIPTNHARTKRAAQYNATNLLKVAWPLVFLLLCP